MYIGVIGVYCKISFCSMKTFNGIKKNKTVDELIDVHELRITDTNHSI